MADENDNQDDQKPKRRVVVTHYGKKKKSEDGLPEEIVPQEPTHILSSPVDIESASQDYSQSPPAQKESETKPAQVWVREPKAHDFQASASVESARYEHTTASSFAQQSHNFENHKQSPQQTGMDMNNNDDNNDTPPPVTTVRSGNSIFFSLLILGAVLGLGYYSYSMQQKINELALQASNSKNSVSALVQEAKVSIDKINAQERADIVAQNQLNALKEDVLHAQQQLIKLKGDTGWALAEANYLAFMANLRLKSAHDVPTAITQLIAADKRLQETGNPGLSWVREVIAKDIANLKSLPEINKQVIWEQIENISNSFYQLNFKRLDEQLVEGKIILPEGFESLPRWRQSLIYSWYEIKSLVRITRQDKNSVPMALGLQEETQVLRTMQLLCLQAQWALLEGKSAIYQGSLKALNDWLTKYFDDTEIQKTLISQIKELESQNVVVQVPDISPSIQALSKAMDNSSGSAQSKPLEKT